MGSRYGRHAALVAAVASLAFAGCTVGAPPGFSSGNAWTLPLVGPLEDGLLLVPATVNGAGPFLFAIDPDAKVSSVDEEVVTAAHMRGLGSVHFLDETDTQQVRFIAEVNEWRIGSLVYQPTNRTAMVVKNGTFDADGRRIHGLIGRDILADSLVFTFNRNQGQARLLTHELFKKPAAPDVTIHYDLMSAKIDNAEIPPLGRRLASVQINGHPFKLHLDFGAVASQLDEAAWTAAKLTPTDIDGAVTDEVGMAHPVKKEGIAHAVTLGRATVPDVVFLPYGERRWAEYEVPGTLGLGFFKPFSATIDWDSSTVYLFRRQDVASTIAARIARWDSLATCAHLGCATVSLIDPLAGKPPEQMPAQHPGVVVSVARDGAYKEPLEVLVAATSKDGKPLSWLVANLPAGADRAMIHLGPEYVGAQLLVVDASPFPRACRADGGCIDALAAPMGVVGDATVQKDVPLVRAAGQAPDVSPELMRELKKRTGSETLQVMFDICIDAAGSVQSIRTRKSTGFTDIDDALANIIRASWKFEPKVIDGQPRPVCGRHGFTYHYVEH